MMKYQKQILLSALICVGLFNLLLPQVVVAARDWWRQFREENFDQPDLSDLANRAFGRPRRDLNASGYRFVGGALVALAIVLWWVSP